MNFYFIISPFLKKHSKNKKSLRASKVVYLVLPAERSQFQADVCPGSHFLFFLISHYLLSLGAHCGDCTNCCLQNRNSRLFYKMWNPDSSSRYEFQTFPHKVTLDWLCPFIKDDPTPAESSPCLLSFVPLVPLPPLAQQLFCKAVLVPLQVHPPLWFLISLKTKLPMTPSSSFPRGYSLRITYWAASMASTRSKSTRDRVQSQEPT